MGVMVRRRFARLLVLYLACNAGSVAGYVSIHGRRQQVQANSVVEPATFPIPIPPIPHPSVIFPPIPTYPTIIIPTATMKVTLPSATFVIPLPGHNTADTNIPDLIGGFLTGDPSDTTVGLGQVGEPSIPIVGVHSTGTLTDTASGILLGSGDSSPLDTSIINAHSDSGNIGLPDIVPVPVNPVDVIPVPISPGGALPVTADPVAVVPVPVSPTGAIPVPASPVGIVPVPASPAGVVPVPVSPLATIPVPANPEAVIPVPAKPADVVPVPANPAWVVPVPVSPAGALPVPASPVGIVPVPASPVGVVPVPVSPASTVPVPANPVGAVPVPIGPPVTNAGEGTSGFVGLLQGLGAGTVLKPAPIAQPVAPATGLLPIKTLLRREAPGTRERRFNHKFKGPRRVDTWEDHEKRQDSAGNVLSTLNGAAASLPQVPSAPQLPSVPQVPSTPQVPSVPQVPSAPDMPSTPSLPVADIEAIPGNATSARH